MKTTLSIAMLFLSVIATAQEKKKFNIYLNMEKDGKEIIIDTSFQTREEMEAFMKSSGFNVTHVPSVETIMDIEIPGLPELPDLENSMNLSEFRALSEEEKTKMREELKAAQKELEKASKEMRAGKKEMDKAREEMKRIRIQVSDSVHSGETFIFQHDGGSVPSPGKRKMVVVEVEGEGDSGDHKYEYRIFKLPCDSVQFWKENGSGNEEGNIRVIKKIRTSEIDQEIRDEVAGNAAAVKQAAAESPTASLQETPSGSEGSADALQADNYRLNASDFRLYPNPTQGKINVSFQLGESGPVQVRLLDANGRVIVDEEVLVTDGYFNREYSIEGKARGTYLLQLKQGSKWRHEKIVVK